MFLMPFGGWGKNWLAFTAVMLLELQSTSMKSFLKSSRQAGSKKYLGVIGSLLFEIVDEEPVIEAMLNGNIFRFSPSQESRYSGAEKRMILTTFSHDALLIFNTLEESPVGDKLELNVFINNSQTSSVSLLKEAEELVMLRWTVTTLKFRSSSEKEKKLFFKAGWLTEPGTNEVLTKCIVPAWRKRDRAIW